MTGNDIEIKALKERCDRLEAQVDMLMTKWVDLGKFAQSLKKVYYGVSS